MDLPDTLPENLIDLSWEELAYLCDLSRQDPDAYYEKYKGQLITIPMQCNEGIADQISDNAVFTVRDCGNMDRVAGGKCGLYFVVKSGFGDFQINDTNNVTGGYPSTTFATNDIPKIISSFPDDLASRFDRLKLHIYLQPNSLGVMYDPEQIEHPLTENNVTLHVLTAMQWFGDILKVQNGAWPGIVSNDYIKTDYLLNEETWLRYNKDNSTNNSAFEIDMLNYGVFSTSFLSSVFASSSDYISFMVAEFGGTSFRPSYCNPSVTEIPTLAFSLTNNDKNPGVDWLKPQPEFYLACDYVSSSSEPTSPMDPDSSGSSGSVATAPGVYALAESSSSSQLAWIPADTEHHFLDETNNWSLMKEAATHNINNKGDTVNPDDHGMTFFAAIDGGFPPTAKAGSKVTVNHKLITNWRHVTTSHGAYLGISEVGKDPNKSKNNFIDYKRIEKQDPSDGGRGYEWPAGTWTFTMPDHDVDLWFDNMGWSVAPDVTI